MDRDRPVWMKIVFQGGFYGFRMTDDTFNVNDAWISKKRAAQSISSELFLACWKQASNVARNEWNSVFSNIAWINKGNYVIAWRLWSIHPQELTVFSCPWLYVGKGDSWRKIFDFFTVCRRCFYWSLSARICCSCCAYIIDLLRGSWRGQGILLLWKEWQRRRWGALMWCRWWRGFLRLRWWGQGLNSQRVLMGA